MSLVESMIRHNVERLLTKHLEKNNCHYHLIENYESLLKIENLFSANELFQPATPEEFHYVGLYYKINEDYDQMKKYYFLAIANKYIVSVHNLAWYYYNIEKNYDLAKKYYLMAAENGYARSFTSLGNYYQKIEKNYALMKKYYVLGFEKGYTKSFYRLGKYYEDNKRYDKMEKYYLLAIKRGDWDSSYDLRLYYKETNKSFEDMLLCVKYRNVIGLSKKEVIQNINDVLKLNLNRDQINQFMEIITQFDFSWYEIPPELGLLLDTLRLYTNKYTLPQSTD